jgi:hypothetical protein
MRPLPQSAPVLMQDAIEKETVLSHLMGPPCDDDTQPGRDGCCAVAKLRNLRQQDVKRYLETLREASLSAQCSSLETVADQMQHLTKLFAAMSEEELDEHAAHAAEFLWCTCRDDVSSNKLVLRDFQTTLQNEKDAEFAFSLFDLDKDGFVVEAEVHERCKDVYRCAPLVSGLLCIAPHVKVDWVTR